uniref:rRNA N-glycosidase n=1 Tax=Oryza nivara TaxID=4536 RepID=A0A0E0J812_ORYNI
MAPKREKKKKNLAAVHPPPRPRNTVTLRLEGTEEEFLENFNRCQAHFQYWLLMNSPFRIRFGDQVIYTTPLDGTFYYVLQHEGRCVILVVLARMAWLIGFCTTNGFFQMEFEDLMGLYMDSVHSHLLRFKGNHHTISPNGTGNTTVNLQFIRKCFHGLCTFVPSKRQDPKDLPMWIGLFVVLIMESKSREIHRRHCHAILEVITPELGRDYVNSFIKNWSSISAQVMGSLTNLTCHPHDCGIDVLVFYYLHVDAWNGGLFEHESLAPPPREMKWSPVDPGVGDANIRLPQEPALHGRGHKRTSAATAEMCSKRARGLLGGGLGGPPTAPDFFVRYVQGGDQMQKQECDHLVSHLVSFGITVKNAIRTPAPTSLVKFGQLEDIRRRNNLGHTFSSVVVPTPMSAKSPSLGIPSPPVGIFAQGKAPALHVDTAQRNPASNQEMPGVVFLLAGNQSYYTAVRTKSCDGARNGIPNEFYDLSEEREEDAPLAYLRVLLRRRGSWTVQSQSLVHKAMCQSASTMSILVSRSTDGSSLSGQNPDFTGCGCFPLNCSHLETINQLTGALPTSLGDLPYLEGWSVVVPVGDGNIVQVISRLHGLTGQPVNLSRPGDFNQTMMELGETLCSKVKLGCSQCPTTHDWFQKPKRCDFVAACVVRIAHGLDQGIADAMGMNILFLLIKWPEEGLRSGLWEFPSVLVNEETGALNRRKRWTDVKWRSSGDPQGRSWSTCSYCLTQSLDDVVPVVDAIMVLLFELSADLNQAMMELGATLCSDTKPSRFQCPLSLVAAKRSHFPAKARRALLLNILWPAVFAGLVKKKRGQKRACSLGSGSSHLFS